MAKAVVAFPPSKPIPCHTSQPSANSAPLRVGVLLDREFLHIFQFGHTSSCGRNNESPFLPPFLLPNERPCEGNRHQERSLSRLHLDKWLMPCPTASQALPDLP